MKTPDKKLVQTLLQGGSRLCGSKQDAVGISKSFSRFTLENDWNFSEIGLVHPVEHREEKFPHIRTLRFFTKEKDEIDEHLMNSFSWEHYKRNLNFHPLMCLEILNTKFSRDLLDLPLINEVGGRRFDFLRLKRGGRYKDLYRQGAMFLPKYIEAEDAKQKLSVLLAKHSDWIELKQWPRSMKIKDAKDWYGVISVLDHEYLRFIFKCEVGDWCSAWLNISRDLPLIAQRKLMDAFRDQDKAVLNGFYGLFLGVDADESLGSMDFSILLRALGKKYATHTLKELTTPARLVGRWQSALHLAFSNYQPWEATEMKGFIDVYKFLTEDKETGKLASYWRSVGFNRFSHSTQQELTQLLKREYKSEADYEWIPLMDNIFRLRKGMMGAF